MMKKRLVLSVISLCLSFFSCSQEAPFAGSKKSSDKGSFDAYLTGIDNSLSVGADPNMILSLTKKGERTLFKDLPVKVSFIHTAMGHGGTEEPEIEKQTDGTWKLTKMIPSMAGTWKITLTIGEGEKAEKVEYDVKVTD